jgi:uncharacterized repeat protein (TIGR01451 family)
MKSVGSVYRVFLFGLTALLVVGATLGAFAQSVPVDNQEHLTIANDEPQGTQFSLVPTEQGDWTPAQAPFDSNLPLPSLVLRAEGVPDGAVAEVARDFDSPFVPVVFRNGVGRIPLTVPNVAALQRMVVRCSCSPAARLTLQAEKNFALRVAEEQGVLHLYATFWGQSGVLRVSVKDSRGEPLEPLSDEGRRYVSIPGGWTDFGPVSPGERAGFLVIPSATTAGPITARFRSSAGKVQKLVVPYSGAGPDRPEATGVCATPGKDGNAGVLTGIINTYYPVTSSVSAGASSIPVGTATGATTTISAGDLLIVIQMQDAAINSTNASAYGDGTTKGYGYTAINGAGKYEYVVATGPVSSGSVPIRGAGGSNGLLNAYTVAASTATRGRSTAQVVRVPQYMTATLSSTLTCKAWDGSTGGILAMDVCARLTLSGTTSVNGMGFRGGLQQQLAGQTTPAVTMTDYRILGPATSATTVGTGGMKGEGIAGTPRLMPNANNGTGLDGYPNGDWYRGGPGNAGGGGNDSTPTTNNENAGGGGGGNGGVGGTGGASWNGNQTIGGFPGGSVAASGGVAVLGGGGGAGSRNNVSIGGNGSGAAGGGIVLIRALTFSGTGAITANGADGQVSQQDASGGGGAGGTIIIYAKTGGLSGLSVTAQGGRGGDAWPAQAPGTWPGQHHGPGGGGGGGSILLSSAAGISSVNGGMNGVSCTDNDAYGSTPGSLGVISTTLSEAALPGADPGYLCATPSTYITKTSSAGAGGYVGPGQTITYTMNVTNTTPTAWTGVAVNDPLPANTSFVTASTQVTKVTYPTGNYADSFTAQAYSGTTGSLTWSNPWTEIGEADGPTAGNVQVVADPFGGAGYSLRINNTTTRGIYRALDLSAYSNASLSFQWARAAMTQNDTMTVQVSTNGGTSWTTLKTITGYYYNSGNTSITDTAYLTEYYDLTPYLSANFRLRFYPGATFAHTMYFDNINISAATTIVVNPIGGSPPTLVSGQTLNPGESMTVTFQVTVNDPLDPAATSIDNTASVTTSGGVNQPASVSNPIIPAPVVNSPIYALDTGISGTSTVIGGTITVYKNGLSIGTATVQPGGTWTLTGVSGLAAGDLITAKVSSNGATSAVSNTVTVVAQPQILKTSSAGGASVSPGQLLTYTLVLYNNSVSTWTNMVLTDAVPTNTTFVAGSGSVSGAKDQTYYDQFTLTPIANPQSYQGSNGTLTWPTTSPWTEISDDGNCTTGDVRVVLDGTTNALRLTRSANGVSRPADLSVGSSGILTFDYRRNAFDADDQTYAQISNDNGATFPVTLFTVSGAGTDASYQSSGSLPIPSAYQTSAFQISFITNGTTANGHQTFIDNVRITLRQAASCTGFTPPALVGGASPCTGYSLLPGEKLTVTFQVTVNDPLPPGTTSIVNQAVWAHDGVTQPSTPTDTVTDSVNLTPPPVVSGPILSGATSASGTSTSPAGTVIDVYVNGTKVGTTTVLAGGAWTLTGMGPLAAGDLVKATATDSANGKATSAYSNVVTVQCQPPVVSGPISASPASISGTGPANTLITVYSNGGTALGTVTSDGAGNWSLSNANVSALKGGEAITAKAGSGGSQSASSNTVVVAPVVTTPANGSSTTNTTPALAGTSAPNATVDVILDGTTVTTVTADGSGNWTYTPASPLSYGAHTLKATATNGATTSGDSNTNTFTILTPSIPPIVTSSIVSTSPAPQTVYGSSIEAAGSTITVYVNGVALATQPAVQADGSWSLTGVTLAAGDLVKATVQAPGKGVSGFGNTVTVSATSGAVTPPPVVTPGLSDGATTVGGTSTSPDGTVIDVYADGVFLGTATVTGGAWTLPGVGPLSGGAILTATATAPCPAVCTGTSDWGAPVVVGTVLMLLRADAMTTLEPPPSNMFTHPEAAPPYPSLETLGPNHFFNGGEGVNVGCPQPSCPGTNDDDKAYIRNIKTNDPDPDTKVLDASDSRVLIFYELLDNNTKTLYLNKSGDGTHVIFTITP